MLNQFFFSCQNIVLNFCDVLVLCVYYTGETSFGVVTEADSNDITGHPHDDKPRPYMCTVCDKRFTMKGNLNKHKQSHMGEMLYSCTQCAKRYATEDSLRKHMNVHSSKYKCTECGKCVSSKHALRTHGRSHSGEKPFECTVCSKRFTTSHILIKHSRIHSGEKPYKCKLCDKAFSQSSSLNIHVRAIQIGRAHV